MLACFRFFRDCVWWRGWRRVFYLQQEQQVFLRLRLLRFSSAIFNELLYACLLLLLLLLYQNTVCFPRLCYFASIDLLLVF